MPWHIFAPRAVACDNLHLRASAHHWHMSAFYVIENSSEFPITQKTAANSVICLQISAAVYLLFDLFLLYIWPLRQDHTVVRKFAACSFLKLRKKILDCQVFLLLSGHIIDHVACVHHDQTVPVGDRIAHVVSDHECCQMLTVYDRIGCLKNLRCRLRVEGCRVLV